MQDQGLLAQLKRLAVVSQAAVVPAEVGERDGPADLVAQLVEQLVCASRGVERVGLPALQGVHDVASVMRPRLSGEVVT